MKNGIQRIRMISNKRAGPIDEAGRSSVTSICHLRIPYEGLKQFTALGVQLTCFELINLIASGAFTEY